MNDGKIDSAPPASIDKPQAASDAIDRRGMLRMAGAASGLVVIGGVAGCGGGGGNSPPTGPVTLGNVSALSVGTMRVMGNVVVGRDSGGVYAMSAVCTHMGCIVSTTATSGAIASGLTCFCHQSTYDANGANTGGPAPSPLQHYFVTIDASGLITADASMPVAVTARTPVA